MNQRGADWFHRQLIDGYTRNFPGTEVRGFEAAMRAVVKGCRDIRSEMLANEERLEPIGFRPDAYRVDFEAMSVWLVEAQVTSRITPRKWQAISDLWWKLDPGMWDVWVHIVDRNGSVFSVDTPLVAMAEADPDPCDSYKQIALSPPGRFVWHPDRKNGPIRDPEWKPRRMRLMTSADWRAMGDHERAAETELREREWEARS